MQLRTRSRLRRRISFRDWPARRVIRQGSHSRPSSGLQFLPRADFADEQVFSQLVVVQKTQQTVLAPLHGAVGGQVHHGGGSRVRKRVFPALVGHKGVFVREDVAAVDALVGFWDGFAAARVEGEVLVEAPVAGAYFGAGGESAWEAASAGVLGLGGLLWWCHGGFGGCLGFGSWCCLC